MSPEARIAVIVPCYSDGFHLARTVASVDEAEPVEIVIVDDGSSDPLTHDALAWIEEHGLAKVVRHETNRGVSAARMTALAESSAPYVFPLDADDLAIPGRLGEMADLLDADPGAAVAYGDYVEFDAHLLIRSVPSVIDPYRIIYTNEYPPSALHRRSVLERVGGWRQPWEGIDSRSDWSLWMALAEAGERGIHVGEKLSYLHRIHEGRLQERGRGFHREIYESLRERHASLFASARNNRSASRMPAYRKLLYPALYGRRSLRTRSLEAAIKRTLDAVGIWTLQRSIDESERARIEAEISRVEALADRIPGALTAPAPLAPVGTGLSAANRREPGPDR